MLSLETYDQLFRVLPMPLLVIDEASTVVMVSGGWRRLVHRRDSGPPYLGLSYIEVIGPVCELATQPLKQLQEVVEVSLTTFELLNPVTLGRAKNLFEFTVVPLSEPKPGAIILCRDVSETRYAGYDALTDLLNRSLFDREARTLLRLAERSNEQVSLIYLDLDNFKSVNDRWGHEVGDSLLKRIAERLKRVSRESDLVARYGGDEFVFLLYKTTAQSAISIAERYQQALAQPFALEPGTLTLQSSWGLAHFPQSATLQDLLNRADKAMYQAKREGGGLKVAT